MHTAEQNDGPGATPNELENLHRLNKALHDLCQPLTTLQCRLEMAGVLRTADAYRDAVELGLGECSRLLDAVSAMRGLLRETLKQAESASSLRDA